MKNFIKIKWLFFVAMLCLLPFISAQALHINNLFFIGDSISDQGNCDLFPFKQAPPITNGNTYAYHLGQKFNKDIFRSRTQGGTDYACVGGSTGYNPEFPFVVPPFTFIKNGPEQVQELLKNNPTINKHDLFVYWLGSNDILLSDPIADIFDDLYPTFNAINSANNVVTGLNMLHQAGARYILVFNVSPLEKTPAAINDPAHFNDYKNESIAFNQALLQRMNNIGYEIIQVDIYSVVNHILENASLYGFANTTHECKNPLPGQSCETSFYYDDVHPTDKAHRMLADFIYSMLTAPDFVASLAEIPLDILRAQNNIIYQQLFPQQQFHEVGEVYPFASSNIAAQTQPAISADRASFSSNGGNVTVGFTQAINEQLTWGLAAGQTIYNTNYDLQGSFIRTQSTILSLFGGYQYEKFYLNGIINYAYLHYGNIQRKFNVGPVLWSADGNTHGNQHGISFLGGYNFVDHDNFQFGPIANLGYQRINVNGYEETGAEVFDMVFDDQKNTSLVSGLGLQATFKKLYVKNIPWMANVFVMLNKEFLGGDRLIYFHQASLNANFAGLPVFEPNYTAAVAGINVAALLPHNIIASIGYMGARGDYNAASNLIMLGLTIPL